jgi:hypothetical protein
MIDPNTCSICFPTIHKLNNVKIVVERREEDFTNDNKPRGVGTVVYHKCGNPAIQHIDDFVDPSNPKTRFTLHRCSIHVKRT